MSNYSDEMILKNEDDDMIINYLFLTILFFQKQTCFVLFTI